MGEHFEEKTILCLSSSSIISSNKNIFDISFVWQKNWHNSFLFRLTKYLFHLYIIQIHIYKWDIVLAVLFKTSNRYTQPNMHNIQKTHRNQKCPPNHVFLEIPCSAHIVLAFCSQNFRSRRTVAESRTD